jgi:hypothetical protein
MVAERNLLVNMQLLKGRPSRGGAMPGRVMHRIIEQNGDDSRAVDNHDQWASAWQTAIIIEKSGAIRAFHARRTGGADHREDPRDISALGRGQSRRPGYIQALGLPGQFSAQGRGDNVLDALATQSGKLIGHRLDLVSRFDRHPLSPSFTNGRL